MSKIEVVASPALLELTNYVPFEYKTQGSCAIDLRAVSVDFDNPNTWWNSLHSTHGRVIQFNSDGELNIYPGEQFVFDPGLKIWLGASGDNSLTGLVLPRSGLGSKGLVLGNTIGLIDNDYQGTLFVVLWNRSPNTHTIKQGDRIAQYLVTRSVQMKEWKAEEQRTRTFVAANSMHEMYYQLVEKFSNASDRGEGGFGHTGKA